LDYALGIMECILQFICSSFAGPFGNGPWKDHFKATKFTACSVFSKADEILNALHLLRF